MIHLDTAKPGRYAPRSLTEARQLVAQALGPFDGGTSPHCDASTHIGYVPVADGMRLVELCHSRAISVRVVPPRDHCVFVTPCEGSIEHVGTGKTVERGQSLFIGSGQRAHLSFSNSARLFVLAVNQPRFSQIRWDHAAAHCDADAFRHMAGLAIRDAMLNPQHLQSVAIKKAWQGAFEALFEKDEHAQETLLPPRLGPMPFYVARATNLICETLAIGLRVEDVVEASGVSRRTLYRGFDACFGQSIGTVMKYVRLKAARNLLLQGKDKGIQVSQAAEHVGFEQSGEFSRAYKLLWGETPSQTLKQPTD